MPPDTADTFTAAFRAGLALGTLPPGVTATPPDEAARRFAVYRNNVAQGLARALAAQFPVVGRLLGDAYFRALVPVYLQADPPVSPVLSQWGGGFPQFLAGFPPLAGLPWLADVARLEALCAQAFHAADAAPAPAAVLQAAAGGAARLGLHPSVRILASAHAVVTIWTENQPGRTPGQIADRPETALVLRDPADRVAVVALRPGDAAFVQALAGGAGLPAAAHAARRAAPAHDPGALLALLLRHGALTEV